jgi:hypothetical protein
LPVEEIIFDPSAGKPFWVQMHKGAIGRTIFTRFALKMHELLARLQVNTNEQLPKRDQTFRSSVSSGLENLPWFGYKVGCSTLDY